MNIDNGADALRRHLRRFEKLYRLLAEANETWPGLTAPPQDIPIKYPYASRFDNLKIYALIS